MKNTLDTRYPISFFAAKHCRSISFYTPNYQEWIDKLKEEKPSQKDGACIPLFSVSGGMLNNPYRWENFLRSSNLWWDLTYYEYKYGEPIGWTAKDLLERINSTYVDGDSYYQVRIHEIKTVDKIAVESAKD